MTVGHALVAFKTFLINRPVKDIENSVIRRHSFRFRQACLFGLHPEKKDEEIEERDRVCVCVCVCNRERESGQM